MFKAECSSYFPFDTKGGIVADLGEEASNALCRATGVVSYDALTDILAEAVIAEMEWCAYFERKKKERRW